MTPRISDRHRTQRLGFSLAELLVVVGLLALILGIMLPPLQAAREKARQAKCAGNLHQLGQALSATKAEFDFYPRPHDGGVPVRYTWIDLLLQRGALGRAGAPPQPGAAGIGYCPSDSLPDPYNVARHSYLNYPHRPKLGGVDYSYGIGVPLAVGGWVPSDQERLVGARSWDPDRHTSQRVLAGDAYAAGIYNLNGVGLTSGVWNEPTWYDNTVGWLRHRLVSGDAWGCNLLYQDGHVSLTRYSPTSPMLVNTMQTFVWQPGEPVDVTPGAVLNGRRYPAGGPSVQSGAGDQVGFPPELSPSWYSRNGRWTHILHK